MARIVEFRSSEQPHMSITESMYYRLAEPLVFRDLDGVLGDIVAACCRRCGEVTLRSDEVANHLCISSERTDRLVAKGIGVFREIVARKDTEAALAALQQRVERLEGALRKAEWGAMGTHYGEFIPECPVCLNNPVQRHADDCELSAALADAGTGVAGAVAGSCRCGRRLIRDGAGDPDPWCEGCAMSAKTCDCVSVQREASHAANGD